MKLLKLIIALNLSLSIGLLNPLAANAAPRVIEQVAAVVNNNVILESDVQEMLKTIKASTNPNNLPNDKILRQQIIDRLIVENLILQKAAKAKITVSDDEVTKAIAQIASENGMTVNQLRSKLSTMGISYSAYRERIHNDMLIDQTRMNEVRHRINISDKEVENLSKSLTKQLTNNLSVKISHILIAIPEKASKQQVDVATEKARDVINRAKKGENFAKLAASYSNDDLALKGGNMGWRKLNELPTIFEERLIRAPKDSIIGPIRSGVGLHILKVDDTRTEKPKAITVQEVDARHILIKTNVLVTDQIAKQKLTDIRKAIVSGATTFEAAAKAYSEDPGSADNGGNLGWSMPERYDTGFKNGLLKLKKGEISQPVQSAYGWHLIQLLDTRKADKTESAKQDHAYRLIFNRKFAEESQIWIQELKGDAYIKIKGVDDNE
ncbi:MULTISPECIES: peptidylprolyl isomerase SurA [unclassified Gilliamella]|uniref:peptidylprolyl isomerase SurA n=1 Tax=unclassified Gilliamella TaxID=2685620 RepID=UPI002269FF30|nr:MULTISPECIES: peptidylprolyl isomerase SurA [unclassified Gilliamella]MCX8573896.1 peptidylprolyl isomerase SurA [Gilliamella sp. B3831]MCX8576127.1 peptidylprolyl isomerase SurA [Gilliamella sp. B3815]MCX8603228.1 peptidylprolyl isomerase SurA [Gilliamella sp. B3823]MCX8606603.1 peptidylprolyl isomerase SurA [Gilliamella sp. B3825]MCX8636673.1 peptidylprolyl isomerase SurA [Gilliamella sp. B3817]